MGSIALVRIHIFSFSFPGFIPVLHLSHWWEGCLSYWHRTVSKCLPLCYQTETQWEDLHQNWRFLLRLGNASGAVTLWLSLDHFNYVCRAQQLRIHEEESWKAVSDTDRGFDVTVVEGTPANKQLVVTATWVHELVIDLHLQRWAGLLVSWVRWERILLSVPGGKPLWIYLQCNFFSSRKIKSKFLA